MSDPISLALSGGGIRAMAFHLGVLKRLAELQLLERVRRISTVSGGSLLTGLIYREAQFKWPTSAQYIQDIYPSLRRALCARSMQWGAAEQLQFAGNWKYILSRANLLAVELRKHWGMDVPLSRIPADPEWSINGTTAETGKRFRFKGTKIGDWSLGYADAPDFCLADAMAVSAAFPFGFGPLALDTTKYEWKKAPSWVEGASGVPEDAAKPVKIAFEKLHLYDAGLYDNLGSESLFDPGTQRSKHPGDYIIVSDAGAPMAHSVPPGPLNPWRIKRMMDIMSEQSRGLRIRAFFNYLAADRERGAMVLIGTPVYGHPCAEAQFARSFPTSLKRLDESTVDRLAKYGYAVACATEAQSGVG